MKLARRTLLLAIAAAAITSPVACRCNRGDDDDDEDEVESALPPITVTDDTPGLVLTWIDAKGGTHTATRPPDVPAEGRSMVRVVVSNKDEGTHDLFYVADLTKPGSDGAYPVQTMSRADWEAEIERRRQEGPSDRPRRRRGEPADDKEAKVIIYGASWCKPCHKARDYLRSRRVPLVFKDIEEDADAAAEMKQKVARSGQRAKGIPVIDVAGHILLGFNRSKLDRALKGSGLLR